MRCRGKKSAIEIVDASIIKEQKAVYNSGRHFRLEDFIGPPIFVQAFGNAYIQHERRL